MTASLRVPAARDYEQLTTWITDAAACRRWAGPRVAFPFTAVELPLSLALEAGASYCLIDNHEALLGFGQYCPRPDGAVHLMRLIVSPARRGEGWGRVLCGQLMEHALQATDARSVTLKVYRDNMAAMSLYESLGFRRDESLSDTDSWFMRKQTGVTL